MVNARKMMIKQIIICGCLVLVVFTVLLYFFQRHLIYFPTRQTPRMQDYQADDLALVSLRTDDGLVLKAWYKPAILHKVTVLYLHGNAGHIGFRMPLARQLINAGFGVLLVEYRGFGGNPGYPSEQGLYQDGRAGLRFLQQRGVQSQHVILFGESLGTGVATELAVEYPVCAVVLQSPFTSLVSVARYHYPWLFIKPWDRFDSANRVQEIHAPLLILHGKKDHVVPYAEGVELYNRALEPKEIVSFDEGTHNNLWGDKDFSKKVFHFLKTRCP